VVFTAADADVIKTYVKLGLGVGIVASMAYDPKVDTELVAIDASHLFAASTTKIGCRRGIYLRSYMYDFICLFSPHLRRDLVADAMQTRSKTELDTLFRDIRVPDYPA